LERLQLHQIHEDSECFFKNIREQLSAPLYFGNILTIMIEKIIKTTKKVVKMHILLDAVAMK
jgi:hypothetical protein